MHPRSLALFCAFAIAASHNAFSGHNPIAEPSIAWTQPLVLRPSLRGYLDMHLHLFGHMGHGGGVLAGASYDPHGDINTALENDSALHGWHGLLGDMTGYGSRDGADSNFGPPSFESWPKWHSTTHQQAYYKWLERAYRGGLRMMTMMAVTNEALCRLSKPRDGFDCKDSMASINAQIDETYAFEAFVDAEYGGVGRGWFRIVTTPEEARRVILDGKLAVVLGIEVDNLFGCRHGDDKNGKCTPTSVAAELDAYYRRGVRHIFPIHNFDNAFGAPAVWQVNINVGNRAVEGVWWETEPCPKGYGYTFRTDWTGSARSAAMVLGGFGILSHAPVEDEPACHARGLSDLGRSLIAMMMDRGFLIDIDHMSNKSIDDTLSMAEARRPVYPIVASHILPLEMNHESTRSERLRTREQLERIRDTGGMVAMILKDHQQDLDGHGKRLTYTYDKTLPDNCRHSSKSWAQSYRYVSDIMGGAVGLGSDFNGIAAHIGPRFGKDACGGEDKDGIKREARAQIKQSLPIRYPFTDPDFGTFDHQITGDKVYDFNVDGMAHVGLLPDFIEDLRTIGLSETQLEPIFSSAEAYIQVWERAILSSSF